MYISPSLSIFLSLYISLSLTHTQIISHSLILSHSLSVLGELWALLNFIEPAKFPDQEKFAARFGTITTQEQVSCLFLLIYYFTLLFNLQLDHFELRFWNPSCFVHSKTVCFFIMFYTNGFYYALSP